MAINKNRFAFQAGTSSQAYAPQIESTTLIQPGQWYHVAATFTAFGTMRLYVNGVLEAEKDIPTYGRALTDIPIGIGGSSQFTDRFLEGTLNDVRVYNVARTPAEILAEYQRLDSLDPRGLVGFWTFSEAAGDVVPDHSLFGNDGSLLGTAGRLAVARGNAAAARAGRRRGSAPGDDPR